MINMIFSPIGLALAGIVMLTVLVMSASDARTPRPGPAIVKHTPHR